MIGLPQPRDGYLLGVDVSQAQGRLDVPALARQGADFLIAKATDGAHTVDARWFETAAAAQGNGFPFGAYGVLEPNVDPVTQARHFLDATRGVSTTLPPCLDFELARGETGAQALHAAVVWAGTVEQATGRAVVVYTGPAFIAQLTHLAGLAGAPCLAALGRRPLWVAHYGVAAPAIPSPWTDWTLWQASGDHAAHLANGTAVDVDFFRGTLDELEGLG